MPHRATIIVACLALVAVSLLTGCSSNAGEGGIHMPRPLLRASRAVLPRLAGPARTEDGARVEILAVNPTDAPLWLRRLSIDLLAGELQLASGRWEGDRQIDPGTSVLLDISLPMVEGVQPPEGSPEGTLRVEARYARSGLIGLMGGESRVYSLPVALSTDH